MFAGKTPRGVIVVAVESVYFQCSKAIVRSKLWDPARHVDAQEPAEQRHDHGGDHQGRARRRGIRPRVSGAAEGDDLLRAACDDP